MSMFCFQCEQTAKGSGCTVAGVCGKKAETADLQDKLTGKMVALAKAAKGKGTTETDGLLIDGLFTTVTNVSFDDASIAALGLKIDMATAALGGAPEMDMNTLWGDNEDIRSLKSLILFGIRGMAAYAHHARMLGKTDPAVNEFFYKSLAALGEELTADELLALVLETGNINLKCMAAADDGIGGHSGHQHLEYHFGHRHHQLGGHRPGCQIPDIVSQRATVCGADGISRRWKLAHHGAAYPAECFSPDFRQHGAHRRNSHFVRDDIEFPRPWRSFQGKLGYDAPLCLRKRRGQLQCLLVLSAAGNMRRIGCVVLRIDGLCV